MKAAVQHCAERKTSSELAVGLGGLWERNDSLEGTLFGPGMEPKPSLVLLLDYFISVKAPLMQRWFHSYLSQEPGEEPSTILAATTYFSKGHRVPLFPQD